MSIKNKAFYYVIYHIADSHSHDEVESQRVCEVSRKQNRNPIAINNNSTRKKKRNPVIPPDLAPNLSIPKLLLATQNAHAKVLSNVTHALLVLW